MSHFTVAVICDDIDDVRSLLAPYQENNMGDCPSEYLEFNDLEDQYLKEWENEGSNDWYADISHRLSGDIESQIKKIKEDKAFEFYLDDPFSSSKVYIGAKVCISGHIDGKLGVENYRDVFAEIVSFHKLSKEELINYLGFDILLKLRRSFDFREDFISHLEKKKVFKIQTVLIDPPKTIPFKEKYETLDIFAEEYHGAQRNEDGKYGYWENPNAKWDWYQVGGRWMGSLLIKEESDGAIGQPGVFNNDISNTPIGYKWVDACKISDICWDKMREISKFELLKNEDIDGDIWEIMIGNLGEELKGKYTMYKSEWLIKRYGNRENYINSYISYSTYAVITPDGKWHSPGEMGWFGCSSETTEEKNEFENNFHKNFIEPYQDKFIVIVDCHI